MNKTVIITGGAKGIGKAISILFSNAGYNVVICYNNSKAEAELLSGELNNSVAVKCDITKEKDVKNLICTAIKAFNSIDVLINNSGIALQKIIQDTSLEEWNNIITTNLTSCFLTSKECIPYMISKRQGVIINISSMWGQVGGSCEVAYSASKSGIIGFTKALAKEVSLSGIRVNCISPGVIDTDMLNGFNDDEKKSLIIDTPLQRLGTPEDIANTALFLASENASFITGQNIAVNGGIII